MLNLTNQIKISGNKLISALDKLAILEDRSRDQHNEFIHECLRSRKKRNRKLKGDENGPDQRTT